MAGVAHFEIYCNDLERARAFYGALFGWKFMLFSPDAEYWLIDIGSQEQGGGLLPRSEPAAGEGTSPTTFVCTMNVDSIEASVQTALEHGGTVIRPKNGIPNMGWVAYLRDPEGNQFGLFKRDPNATYQP